MKALTTFPPLLGTAALLAATAASGHHSPAVYDMEQLVTVDGVVTRFAWANPHVYIHLEQMTESGETIEWAVEGFPPAAMRRMGWSAQTLRPGDVVTVRGNPTTRTRNRGIYPATIETAGRTLFELATVLPRLSSASRQPEAGAATLEGTWETLADLELYLRFFNPDMQLTAAGTAAHESYDEPTMSPALECIPYSAPLLMIDPDFKQIVMDGDTIVIRGGFAPAQRTIHMNGATHDDAARSIQGHSIGRWEGGTLVIETARFSDHRIGNGYVGIPSGSRKRLVERLTPAEGGTRLVYEFELTDPEYLAERMTGQAEWAYRPDLEFAREPCELENARQFTEE